MKSINRYIDINGLDIEVRFIIFDTNQNFN